MKTALDVAPGPEQPAVAPLEFPRARRSLRKVAFVRVWLRRETGDRIWEEETQTQMLSRHGAALACRHAVQPGEVLAIIRRDNGKRVNARVAYSKYNPNGDREIGVELLDNENFWNVNWSSVEPDAPPAEQAAAEAVVTPGENTVDAGKRAWATPERIAEHRRGEWREPARSNSNGAGEFEAVTSPESQWLKLKKRPGQSREDEMAEQVAAQEKRLWRAIREKDAATLRSLLAEDLLWVSPEGAGGNRLDFETYVRREWADRTPGDCEFMRINKAAIVAFLSTWTGAPGGATRDATGAPRRTSIVYHSSVWMRRGGKWWVVFHQVTPAE